MKHYHRFKKIKKDYECKKLENPFFRKNKKGRPKRYTKILVFLGIIVFIFLLWLILASPLFCLKSVKVSGLSRISNLEIEQIVFKQSKNRAWLIFNESNIFLLDDKEIEAVINSKYNFASLEVSKKLFNSVNVKIGERPYSFIFQQGSEFFYASSDAFIIRESLVSEEDKLKYFILENKSADNFITENNKINIKEDYLSFIINLNNKLAIYPDLGVERFVIDQEYNTIKVKLKNGPLVYFNSKNDPQEQVERLVLVKKEKIRDNFSKTNYIDLRYGNKVFIN